MKPLPQPFGEVHAVKCELAGEVLRSSGTLRLQVRGLEYAARGLAGGYARHRSVLESDCVSKGDLVLFSRDRRLFVHRVVTRDVESSSVLTQGDAMPAPDQVIPDSGTSGGEFP